MKRVCCPPPPAPAAPPPAASAGEINLPWSHSQSQLTLSVLDQTVLLLLFGGFPNSSYFQSLRIYLTTPQSDLTHSVILKTGCNSYTVTILCCCNLCKFWALPHPFRSVHVKSYTYTVSGHLETPLFRFWADKFQMGLFIGSSHFWQSLVLQSTHVPFKYSLFDGLFSSTFQWIYLALKNHDLHIRDICMECPKSGKDLLI